MQTVLVQTLDRTCWFLSSQEIGSMVNFRATSLVPIMGKGTCTLAQKTEAPGSFLLLVASSLVVMPLFLVASLLLVAMPGAPGSFFSKAFFDPTARAKG